MSTIRLTFCLVALMAATPALAQDTPAESSPTPAETTQPAEPAADQPETPSADQPAPAEQSPTADATPAELTQGENYVREVFTDWSLRCVTIDNMEDPCEIHQMLVDTGGVKTAEINVFPLPADGPVPAGATIVTPLNTLLTQGVTFGVDTAEPKRYPFTFCSRVGCVAQIGLTEAEVAGLRRGKAAKVSIIPMAAPEKTVELTVSLSGFTAAFNAVSALPQPTPPQ